MATGQLHDQYPWTKQPLICSAPMRMIATAPLATEVSIAGGIGFIGSGNDQSNLEELLEDAKQRLQKHGLPTTNGTLPIGVGIINWGADIDVTIPLLARYRPAALWLFAPRDTSNLTKWAQQTRTATGGATKIWVQVGSVREALESCEAFDPDVLVLQGADAGGHGMNKGCSIVSLVPETIDAIAKAVGDSRLKRVPGIVATGGIVEGRGVAAALALGAQGVTLGTRYLAAEEAVIADGYRAEVIRADDGGQNTVRSSVYDVLRGTTDWPSEYGGRGVVNQSYRDFLDGMSEEDNKGLYQQAIALGDSGWGPGGRMTTYAGTGVGLVRRVQPAATITREVREEAARILKATLAIHQR